jgi:hypothetical protein
VANEGYFQFEHVVSLYNSLFPFPLATAKLIGDVLTFFDHFTPSIYFAYSSWSIQKAANGIGGNNISVPIGKADQIFRMNT